MAGSLITSEVDLQADGKNSGYLRVPHSVHRSAYGWIPVPITVICNGNGPTVLLMAGNHGDEYEGQIALGRLANALATEDVQGRIIILPQANQPACEAGLRTSPLDGANLNRSFPGDPHGSPTEMIAHFIEHELLSLCDYMVDLHSGGSSLEYPCTFGRAAGTTAAEEDRLKALQDAFDLPFSWVYPVAETDISGRSAAFAALRQSAVYVMTELGGGGTVNPDVLRAAERGLRRFLHLLGMLPDYRLDARIGTVELCVECTVHAYDAGVFEPHKGLADDVVEGETIGEIHFPDTPQRASVVLRAERAGMILCKRHMGRVMRGDVLFEIAKDRSQTSPKTEEAQK